MPQTAVGTDSLGRRSWRGLNAAGMPADGGRSDEFAEGASEWPEGLDRREFLRAMGASMALAGLSACSRPFEKIVPYVTPPEESLPGTPRFYATAMPTEGYARGILVESNLGRPTKIEGNPNHPESLGATDAVTQAAVLSLYDPDRSRTPARAGKPSTWAAFEADWAETRARHAPGRGRGLAVLTEPTTSPSLLREIGMFLAAFPEARWYQHTPLASYEVGGLQPDFDFSGADVILSIASDCLYRHPACVRYGRDFARGRRVVGGRSRASRFYAIEPVPSVTGALADYRLPASPGRMRSLLDALGAAVAGGRPPDPAGMSRDEAWFLDSLSRDLRTQAPNLICVAGAEQADDVQEWALALGERLGAADTLVRLLPPLRSDRDRRASGGLAELAEAMGRGDVQTLFILGSNPAYTAPAAMGFEALLPRVPFTVHLGSHGDETASACTWHLPEAHFLEAWSDLRSYGGAATVLQPLIDPLYGGRSALEVLRLVRVGRAHSSYEIVRETWSGSGPAEAFEIEWTRWLRNGVVSEPGPGRAPRAAAAARPLPTLSVPQDEGAKFLVLAPDPNVLDGRWSNNSWLQELPKPMTHLVWDNAAHVGPALARSLNIRDGDVLRLAIGSLELEAAALIMPGQAPDCVGLTLGYGRRKAGTIGTGRGFDAFRLRREEGVWVEAGLKVAPTGARYPLVTTQHHFEMSGRDPVRTVSPGDLHVAAPGPGPDIYRRWAYPEYAWGMSIDLSTCLGCNACVVACQAENNIPVVGKEQVARGREMHWIRIDTYFEGSPDDPAILRQPVTCMQCENAPCELVCPVAATVHSSEGLNQMVYNRCVGTRYCSNNCPYKVRRFNFLDFRAGRDSAVNLQKNPEVTVRERGVMEKCTYCVQRINAARIAASKENRRIADGEIRTACQQACPAEAIVFGNLADPGSSLSRLRRESVSYGLLEELDTRPRTTYLARVARERRSDA